MIGLIKPYLFGIPLILGLPTFFGEWGIWYAGPAAEACLVLLTGVVLLEAAHRNSLRWGVFTAKPARAP